MSKETWLIEPRDALIVRDGRPFGNTAGTRAKSVDFPFPSTTTGGARTRAGLGKINGDLSKFDKNLGDKVLNIEVSGALLAEVEDDKVNLLVHAPADCLIVKPENEGEKNRFPLVPLEKDADSLSNLDDDLHLLGTTEKVKGKPQSEPRFWHWAEFEQWLLKADEAHTIDVRTLGHNGLTKEQRTHVRILDETKGDDRYKSKANSDGGLFQTSGLEFTATNEKKQFSSAKKLALVIEVESQNFDGKIENGVAPLGGERRIVAWGKSDKNIFPVCPKEVRDGILRTNSCRLILLTPAIFENGFKPTWLEKANGLTVTIEAIAVNRAQVISGWDFVKRKPKPTRRMCPAGTVLFLKLGDGDIESWIDNTWFHCVSDLEQDRKDGFGLAALGTWDGNFLKIEEALKQ
jgi:CRISPR-associated protein Cmr3